MKRNSLFFVAVVGATMAATAAAQPGQGRHRPDPEAVIERFDSNGDGMLSLDEFREPPGAGDRFAKADADGDGAVSLDEIRARIDDGADRRLAKAEERFAQSDTDGDGRVTAAERKAALFAELDADGDGLLAADEMSRSRDRREARGRRRQNQDG